MGPRLLAAVFALLLAAGEARAHAMLLETEPAHRAVLGAAPARIVLRFNEPVTPIALRVLDASGRALDLAPRAVDREVVADLPAGLANGTYVASYRVTSADGHPIGGAILFAVGAAPERWGESAETGPAAWRPAIVFNRGAHLLCLFLAAGGLLFFAIVGHRRRPERALAPFAAAAAATAVFGVYLHGAALAGDGNPLSSLFWRAVLAAPQYASAAAALAGLALAFIVAPRFGGPTARAGRIAGAVLALGATGITGHSAAAGWMWWPVAALHLVAAGFWLGSLLPLTSALRSLAPAEAAALLLRFSRMAVPAVVALAIAGLALALQRMDSVQDFIATDYGNLVLAKIAGAAMLVGLAALNKFRLTPALALRSPGAARRLRASIGAEFVLMAGVVGIAAVLAHTDPHVGAARGRDHDHHHHGAPPAPRGAKLRLESGAHVAAIEIHPARPGRNALTVAFATRAGAPIAPLEAVLELALPAAGIEPFSIKLAPLGEGKFAADISELALAGRWQLRLDALITDFEKAIFRGEVEIK